MQFTTAALLVGLNPTLQRLGLQAFIHRSGGWGHLILTSHYTHCPLSPFPAACGLRRDWSMEEEESRLHLWSSGEVAILAAGVGLLMVQLLEVTHPPSCKEI